MTVEQLLYANKILKDNNREKLPAERLQRTGRKKPNYTDVGSDDNSNGKKAPDNENEKQDNMERLFTKFVIMVVNMNGELQRTDWGTPLSMQHAYDKEDLTVTKSPAPPEPARLPRQTSLPSSRPIKKHGHDIGHPIASTTIRPDSRNTPDSNRPLSPWYDSPRTTASPFGSIPADQNGAYTTIYGYFAANNAPLLLDQLLDLFEAQAVGALGIFVANAIGESCLRLVHGLWKYPGPLAQDSANKGKAFGYLDGIEGDAGELVQVNSDMLAQTSASRVLALGHHVAELDAQHHPSYLIPMVLEGSAHMEVVSAYKVFFIPFELTPILLGKGFTPLQAMTIIHPFLSHQGLVETCAPLFDTLRAADTIPSILAGELTLTKASPSSQSEPGLMVYMKSKVLYWDLPGLNRIPVTGDPVLTAVVTALTDHQLRLSEGLDQRCSQSVGGTWGPLYTQRLLLLCAWAQKSKHEKTHMIFQSQVAACASELFIQAPLVTTAVLKRFQDDNFYGIDPFDVADGILPLAFTPLGGSAETLKREQEAAANVAACNTMISTEGNSLNLKDSLELQKTIAYIPIDWTEATTQLESYVAVLATILGVNHKVVQAIADKMGELITPAIVVYYFQIRVSGWLEEHWESTFTIPSPDFGKDFHEL
eukprot:jgi/Psemu1/40403/gm1.40403_g